MRPTNSTYHYSGEVGPRCAGYLLVSGYTARGTRKHAYEGLGGQVTTGGKGVCAYLCVFVCVGVCACLPLLK
jgi:hypothetical protein